MMGRQQPKLTSLRPWLTVQVSFKLLAVVSAVVCSLKSVVPPSYGFFLKYNVPSLILTRVLLKRVTKISSVVTPQFSSSTSRLLAAVFRKDYSIVGPSSGCHHRPNHLLRALSPYCCSTFPADFCTIAVTS